MQWPLRTGLKAMGNLPLLRIVYILKALSLACLIQRSIHNQLGGQEMRSIEV